MNRTCKTTVYVSANQGIVVIQEQVTDDYGGEEVRLGKMTPRDARAYSRVLAHYADQADAQMPAFPGFAKPGTPLRASFIERFFPYILFLCGVAIICCATFLRHGGPHQ